MPRVNVWIPDDLYRTVKIRLPQLNVSAITQGALAAQLECDHARLCCTSCSTPVDHHELVDVGLGRFYRAVLRALGDLANAGGTAEGSCRVVKDVALGHQITLAKTHPLPRVTARVRDRIRKQIELEAVNAYVRQQRDLEASIDRHRPAPTALPTEAESRDRHPTARRTA
jgi:hypothetical protein